MTYTLITFAPVQGFISSSRKLRDLYGSSLLLSYLSRAILRDAIDRHGDGCVVSPAQVKTSRGTPNQLVIEGPYSKGHGRDALLKAWGDLLDGCRQWIEKELDGQFAFEWASSWQQYRLHAWEYFHAQGETISEARQRLREVKQARAWQAINWTGESSTLSGSEAVCWPQMGAVVDPRSLDHATVSQACRRFAEALAAHPVLGEAFIDPREQLSLPELVKRLVTYRPVAARVFAGESPAEVLPERFSDLAEAEQIVWFMADGDRVGEHLSAMSGKSSGGESEALSQFSSAMRDWSEKLYSHVPKMMDGKATVIYAGGDDLLGALHGESKDPLTREDLLHWLQAFPSSIWPSHKQGNLTASMGLVWSQGKVPQREALTQVREAERSAKQAGRNRFALRVLYSSGQHLEWVCPWTLLPRLVETYRDRSGRSDGQALWRHISDDIEWLHSRGGLTLSTASALWRGYFADRLEPPSSDQLGHQSLGNWMRSMARVLAALPAAS